MFGKASDQEACIADPSLIILCLGTKWGNSVVHMLCGFVLLFPELLDPNGMCLMPQESMSCLVDD